jgi:ribosomal protein L11 methyltransferase
VLIELFPEGFEEVELPEALELAAYTDAGGEANLRRRLGETRSTRVAAGWEERWRDFHRPVRAGPLWLGPPWLPAPRDAVAVVIDPGRAFGTGAHPTTRLCLELLLGLEPGELLDVGCGSGVLAIAAARLGFSPVRAIDVDPAAIEAARRNAARNDVAVEVTLADALTAPLQARTVIANISAEAVRDLVLHVDCAWLIASGYLDRIEPGAARFRHLKRVCAEGWAADLYERESE